MGAEELEFLEVPARKAAEEAEGRRRTQSWVEVVALEAAVEGGTPPGRRGLRVEVEVEVDGLMLAGVEVEVDARRVVGREVDEDALPLPFAQLALVPF